VSKRLSERLWAAEKACVKRPFVRSALYNSRAKESGAVFAKPTLDDFLNRIDWHIDKALDRVGKAVADAAQHNALYGSRRTTLSIDAARTEFEAGIETVLGELKRAICDTLLEPEVLHEQAEQRLKKFTEDAKAATQVSDMSARGMADHVKKEFDSFDNHLSFALRQFDVGFTDPPEPEVPQMTNNSITVGNMTGNIQQGSPGASQSFEFKLNVEGARTALHAFETELSKIVIDDRTRLDELAADVATIKAQLSKSSPSLTILQEAGKSLRKITERVVAGVVTSPVLKAVVALGTALGLD
jgi:hypothetical protein